MAKQFFHKRGQPKGTPLAMAMYAVAVIPLIDRVANNARQIWFADDASAGGRLEDLHNWWDALALTTATLSTPASPG